MGDGSATHHLSLPFSTLPDRYRRVPNRLARLLAVSSRQGLTALGGSVVSGCEGTFGRSEPGRKLSAAAILGIDLPVEGADLSNRIGFNCPGSALPHG